MKRRTFIKTVGGAAGGYALGVQRQWAESAEGEVPRRPLGKTGALVSIIGFPGLALVHYEQERCNRGIREAYEGGVNYFDVAPAYGNGEAETKMGPGLQQLDRDKIFLACKTQRRDAEGAREELDRSLRRLKTDHFDLYQLHVLRTPEEVEQALGPGGAMETILKAREQGKVRFIGFSAHTTKAAIAALKGFAFDTVMFPINYVEYHKIGFGKPVLELAAERGAGILAIKPLSGGAWKDGEQRTRRWWYRTLEKPEEISLALRFTWSMKGVAAGIPPSFIDLLEHGMAAARQCRPLEPEEADRLREMAADRPSLFEREENQVALGGAYPHSPYPDCPHGGCPGMMA